MTSSAAIEVCRKEIARAEAGLNPPPPDPRNFWTRLIDSLHPWLGGNFKKGNVSIEVGVEGGAEF